MNLASAGQVVSQGAAQNGCAWMAAAIIMTLVHDDVPASRKPSLIARDGVRPPPLNALPPPSPSWATLIPGATSTIVSPTAQWHTTIFSLKGGTPEPTLH